VSLGAYLPGRSPVHALPAGVKMGGLLVASAGLLLLEAPGALAAALLAVPGLYGLAGLRAREVWPHLRPVGVLLAVLLGLHALLSGWEEAAATVLRLAAVLLLATLVTLTTRASDMLEALERALRPLSALGLRPARLSLLLALTLRFVPMVAGWVREVQEAQAVRGLERHPLALLVPLLVRALRTADALADALEARCYDAEDSP
jgi:biotin transport system permease protein